MSWAISWYLVTHFSTSQMAQVVSIEEVTTVLRRVGFQSKEVRGAEN